MSDCHKCHEEESKSRSSERPPKVIQINNPSYPILFHRVDVPASVGDDKTFPPENGLYKNVLLVYEANNNAYLYSSDGIPTLLTSDVASALTGRVEKLETGLADEIINRGNADTNLQNQINLKANSADLAAVATSGSYNDLTNTPVIPAAQVNSDWNANSGVAQILNKPTLSTVATSGSYSDLSNKPTIGNGALTIQKNGSSVGTFRANATSNATANITVPTTPSDIDAQPLIDSSNKLDADLVDDTTSAHKFVSSSDLSTLSTALQPNDINKTVSTDVTVNSTPSATTVQLDVAKENLKTGATTTSTISLPVASSTDAGVMNAATYNSITNNTNNINALLNGAVAVTGLSASPSQSDITTAWQTETGLSVLINRASVYDVTNDKVWTYYTNDTTWHAASNTSQVTINTFTNSSEGVIKGSTATGQVFAESDGTGSVNGWDSLTNDVSTAVSKLSTIASGAEVNVQADWNQADSSADDYIKNKPTIPTVNNAKLTIQRNGTTVKTFTANASSNVTANITVPTKTSDLTNDGADNTSTYVEADELATVATTGAYSDLTGKPTIPAAQVNSDWDAVSGVAQILNKPSLATVATSGSYNDLSNKPTIPAAQVNSDWDAVSGVAQILNKPSLATVATSGSYNDLTDTPTIPTVNNATLTIQKNGTNVATFTANSSTNATANIEVPVITMQTADPGEGAPLAANNFIAVYEA